MCRWLAYSGPEIHLEDLIIKPSRSLLVQSRFARENYIDDCPENWESVPSGSFVTVAGGKVRIESFRPHQP